MKKRLRVVVLVLVTLAALPFLGFEGVYLAGLAVAGGRPQIGDIQPASEEDRAAWAAVTRHRHPYKRLWLANYFSSEVAHPVAGRILVHRPEERRAPNYWHLKAGAYTVWVTRNLTQEQAIDLELAHYCYNRPAEHRDRKCP